MDDRSLQNLAAKTGALLLDRGHKVATAESCTGGLIAKVLTDIPGSSGWYEGSFITYSNAAKQAMLGVGANTIMGHGAVSEATAREMASQALVLSGADEAVAVTGIAGPDGAVDGKPVGTTWFAWARQTGTGMSIRAEHRRFDGDRDAVRRAATRHALEGLALDE